MSFSGIQYLYGQAPLNIEVLANVPQPGVCNDIWGYVDEEGREYAIIGNRNDTRIYDLQEPSSPSLIGVIPGDRSIWRDYKSFGDFIYGVSDEGREGVTIIDMSMAPDSVSFSRWTDTLIIGSQEDRLNTCHNLFIQDGFLYLAGCNIGRGGVLVYDLNSNPSYPLFQGIMDQRYAHDVIVQDGLIFTSEIFEGNLGIYSQSPEENYPLLSRTRTSSSFTHNAWPSENGKTVFTTDERPGGYVDSYDISNPSSPQMLDQFRLIQNPGATPHNVHFKDDFLITSWYTEGLVVLDASKPDNLIMTGYYDTDPQNRDGAWGAFPFLPSGNILVSDLFNGLFILKPDYRRAARILGTVRNTSGELLNGVSVKILEDPLQEASTNANGRFKTGSVQYGPASIIFSHPLYESDTTSITLAEGVDTLLSVELEPKGTYTIQGSVVDSRGVPIGDASVMIFNDQLSQEIMTSRSGTFEAELVNSTYQIHIAKWGFRPAIASVKLEEDESEFFVLQEGYEDDFVQDQGWTVESTATRGRWTRVIPKATFLSGIPSNPGSDSPIDEGNYCYVTGNDNTSVGSGDVDDGYTELMSREMDLSGIEDPSISFSIWFFNAGGSSIPNDSLIVSLVTPEKSFPVITILPSQAGRGFWRDSISFRVAEYTDNLDAVYLHIKTADDPGRGHIVEAGFDAFSVQGDLLTTSTYEVFQESLTIFPNPTSQYVHLLSDSGPFEFLSIFTSDGKRIADIPSPENPLDISQFKAGLYIIHAKMKDGGMHVSKMIVE
jgi:choice-of-anchor B domain-containing protein